MEHGAEARAHLVSFVIADTQADHELIHQRLLLFAWRLLAGLERCERSCVRLLRTGQGEPVAYGGRTRAASP